MKFEYEDLVLSDKELAETVNNASERMDIKKVTDLILRICIDEEEREPGILDKTTLLGKISYIGHEMYTYGFTSALYVMNESLKKAFSEKEGAAV